MELDAVEIFVKAVQVGSFAEAARQLKIPTTTVSFKIARLEAKLGSTLIHRTTRKLSITPSGRVYYERVVKALGELRAGEAEIESASREPTGTLRLSSSHDVANTILPEILKRYLSLYPQVQIDLNVTNRAVDLVSEGFDLAIRAGKLKDSQLIARKFRSLSGGIWASSAFLRKAGPIESPEDLEKLECVKFRQLGEKPVEMSNGRRRARIALKTRVVADELEAVKLLAQLDLGYALLPDFVVEDGPHKKTLIRILPEWSWARDSQLSLVYPEQAFMTPKLRAFIDLAVSNS